MTAGGAAGIEGKKKKKKTKTVADGLGGITRLEMTIDTPYLYLPSH
jgi:hypothetical protein